MPTLKGTEASLSMYNLSCTFFDKYLIFQLPIVQMWGTKSHCFVADGWGGSSVPPLVLLKLANVRVKLAYTEFFFSEDPAATRGGEEGSELACNATFSPSPPFTIDSSSLLGSNDTGMHL